MKLPINIEKLHVGMAVEGDRIEYKTGRNPDAIYRSICAFANFAQGESRAKLAWTMPSQSKVNYVKDFNDTGDGYIVIGVTEKNGLSSFHPEFVREKVVLNKNVVKDVTKDSIHELTERQKVILMVIKENPLVTIPEMSLKMNVVTRTMAVVRRDIGRLLTKA